MSTLQQNINYPSNEGTLYFFNFSPWRMMQIEAFFYAKGNTKIICKTFEEALERGLNPLSKIFIYGVIIFPEVEAYAKEQNIVIHRIEDAFIRSVALGSAFAKPYSMVIDTRGIYFNPNTPSDLEDILENHHFSEALLVRANTIRQEIVDSKISKYNHLEHVELTIERDKYEKVILVTGQVEDDMSIKLGAFGLNNQELLQMVKERNPKAYIIYKPHPDVLSGNRKGAIDKDILSTCANEVQTLISIDSAIAVSDEVHTLTSGAGFDALLRKKSVYTYGMPFYAGWGLTTDYRTCTRRTTIRSLDELVAGALILYPRYISPKGGVFCEIEQTLHELQEEQERYFTQRFYRYKIDMKAYLLPRLRRTIRGILKPFGLKI